MDLVNAYSKREDLAFELAHALSQLASARQAGDGERRSVQSTGRVGRKHGLQDRLTEDDRRKIVLSYEGGELRQDIAERYGISVSSVARVLRAARNSIAT